MRTIHHRDGHHGWDRELPPVLTVEPGEELELVLADCFGGQLDEQAGPDEIAALDLAAANPLTGPVEVAGSQPGDALSVEILDLEVGSTGWTALIPGFGALADDFPDPYVVVSRIDHGHVAFGEVARLRTAPFLGTIGVAPAAPGPHSVIPPRRVGGNLDCRDVRPGARLLLPVEVPGALLSAGDPHAAQGDGEVCGTAVETTATARLRIDLLRGHELAGPRIELPAEPTLPAGPRWITTGVGPDLEQGARDATRAMIDLLAGVHDLRVETAYALCSVAGHLRIAEMVDAPNWVVVMEFDRSVLTTS